MAYPSSSIVRKAVEVPLFHFIDKVVHVTRSDFQPFRFSSSTKCWTFQSFSRGTCQFVQAILISVAISHLPFRSEVIVLSAVVQMCMKVGISVALLLKLSTYNSCGKASSLRAFDGGLVCRLSYGAHESPGTGLKSFVVCLSGRSAPAQGALGIESICVVNVLCDVTLRCSKW